MYIYTMVLIIYFNNIVVSSFILSRCVLMEYFYERKYVYKQLKPSWFFTCNPFVQFLFAVCTQISNIFGIFGLNLGMFDSKTMPSGWLKFWLPFDSIIDLIDIESSQTNKIFWCFFAFGSIIQSRSSKDKVKLFPAFLGFCFKIQKSFHFRCTDTAKK